MGYTKLYSSILASSVWHQPDHVLRMWVAVLALKDEKGVVSGSLVGLAHLAKLSIEQAENAIDVLTSPDPHSQSKEFDGRRMVPNPDGGWFVVNHYKYRDGGKSIDEVREKTKERVRRHREKGNVGNGVTGVTTVTGVTVTDVTPSDQNKSDQSTSEQNRDLPPSPKRGRAPRQVKTLCPTDWFPSEDLQAYARELGLSADTCMREAAAMRDWSASSGNKKLDWDATFRNWLRRKSEQAPRRPQRQEDTPVLEQNWVKEYLEEQRAKGEQS